MKYIFKYFPCILAIAVFAACHKVDSLPFYANGTAPQLTSDVTSIAPVPADSNATVLTLAWSNPAYATDSSKVKYVVQIDSSGRDFSKAVTREVTGSLSTSFIAKDLNAILIGFGFQFGVPYDVDIRVISSYSNNNEQLTSNVLTLQITPYVVPAKVLPPQAGTLYLVGSATAGGWNNPVPVPAQQFAKIDSLTYEGTFYLAGGAEYLMLPVNGDWSHKYSVADKTAAGLNAGGDFGYDLSDNFPGPAATGMYKISVDFQAGKFVVMPVNLFDLLYVPGDYQGWAPATAATLASPNKDGEYEGYIDIPEGGYEFKLTSQPDWNGTNYGDGSGGTLSTSGGNLTFPGAGYYKVNASITNNTWSVTPTTWGLIGSFAGSGWSNDVDMTYDGGSKSWSGTITIAAGDEFKFRANHDWGLNYGDSGADGSLEKDGDNIKNVPAGTHTITLYLGSSGFYTYKIQ